MKIRWSTAAWDDLRALGDFIAQDDIEMAHVVVDAIYEGAEVQLTEHPNSGPAGRVKGTRELVIPKYRHTIVYQVKTEAVEVVRVIHNRQKWPPVDE